MQFGTFIWPNDPETVRMKFARKVIVQVGEDNSWSITGTPKMARTYECEGVFYGSGAYNCIRALATLYLAGNTARLVHPQWDTANVLLTEMEVTEGPGENLLHYKLTFVELPS